MSYEGENVSGSEPAEAAGSVGDDGPSAGGAPLDMRPADVNSADVNSADVSSADVSPAEVNSADVSSAVPPAPRETPDAQETPDLPETDDGPGDELALDLPDSGESETGEPEADVPEVRADEGGDEFAAPISEEPDVPDEIPPKEWYILKVQSNREDSIADALRRRVAKEGMTDYFDDILVPVEKVTEFKNGKKRVVRRKLYPGYILVHMAFTLETKALVRETPGIGDFTGPSGKPLPMPEHEVRKILVKQQEKTDEAPRLKISFKAGDRVKIKEGHFENFEGDVQAIDEANGRVTVIISIFGRSTPVELDYWQIEAI